MNGVLMRAASPERAYVVASGSWTPLLTTLGAQISGHRLAAGCSPRSCEGVRPYGRGGFRTRDLSRVNKYLTSAI